jgi:hypothetical protein
VKRLVAIDPGGMHHIIGVCEQPPEVLFTEPFFSLVRVTTRAAYYRTVSTKETYTFNEGQK